jgi:hypothetical protein
MDRPQTNDPDLYDSLDGQVALVTGATRGIGAEIAAQLADLNATVYAGARGIDDITAPSQRPIQLDVIEDRTVEAAIDRITDEVDRLDILVNNAGVFDQADSLSAMSMDAFDRTLAVNLRGPTLVTRQALPLLLEQEGGRVVNLSSGLGQFTGGEMAGGYPAYRISKVGLGGLTAYLHAEYATEGLLANAVCPGWVRTDMGGPNAERSPEKGAETPVWLSRFEPGSPGGRFWRDRQVIDW